MNRIAIVGGGIAGLTAAYALETALRRGTPVEYKLFESAGRLGGVLSTEYVERCLLEAGPDSWISEKPWASDLCRELGLADEIIGSNDAARRTYILVNSRLVPMPDGLMFMVPTRILPTVFSPLFSLSTKLRMAREWFHPPQRAAEDETVAALVERHYGAEMVERLADPLLTGIYGGDSRQLSVRAVLPRFVEMEAKYGSLGRAMLAARGKMAGSPPRPLFASLKKGMQQLVDALQAQLTASCIRTHTPVRSLDRAGNEWIVVTETGGNTEKETFDAAILALPANVAGDLLTSANAKVASELKEISYSSSITLNLIYDERMTASLPPGFGFLVPRSEGKRMLACTFVHNKFPHRAPEGRAIVRCFVGGARDEAALDLTESAVIDIARRELNEILGLRAEPIAVRIQKWRGAMAQYGVGHLDRLDRIERLLAESPGVTLAGNGYRGIGIPDCVRSGREAVAKALQFLGWPPQS